MRFLKSGGLTASERVLSDLCERSFLKLWTYPNLYMKPGDELIDLMVLFDRDILLFSDKSGTFPDSGNIQQDWSRFFRRAIAKSAHQCQRARGWLQKHSHKVFLDPKNETPIPLRIPKPEDQKIHMICVVTGGVDRLRTEIGQSGFHIDPSVIDDVRPFYIGQVTRAKGTVHVFDPEAIELLTAELDTISDFVAYLDARRRLIENQGFRGARSESDILAYYLWHNRTFPSCLVPFKIEAGLWPKVEADTSFQAARELNVLSHFWDHLINNLTEHYLDETLEFGNEIDMGDFEKIARVMACETRFHRRILAEQILARADRARTGKIATILPSTNPEIAYVLLIAPRAPTDNYSEYRADRSQELKLRCAAAKTARPSVTHFVGIGLDARGVEGSSEDFILLDTSGWTADQIDESAELSERMGYFIQGTMQENSVQVDEYPAFE